MAFDFVQPGLVELKPRISVIGVGGAGGNAVANMIGDSLQGVDFVVANTDAQALMASPANTRIQLGLKITQGLGAGARPEIGAAAAEEALAEIDEALEGVHMCFIAAGMGGGTGTGAAPVVARVARERGVLTVGVVTKPFAFEGLKRMRAAEEGIVELQNHVDTLIVIPNQNLFLIANQQTTFKQAFAMADEVLNQGVRGITDLMILPGLINLDFADVRTVMSEMGKAMMGTGEAEGERRAVEAAEKAISNPLLDEVSLRGAKAVIINITGGEDLGLMEVEEAAQHIREMVDPEANIIVGSAFNDALSGRMRVSVVATGIEATRQMSSRPSAPALGRSAASLFGASPTLAAAGADSDPEPSPPGGGRRTMAPALAEAAPTAAAVLRGEAHLAPAASSGAAVVMAEPEADDGSLSDADLFELGEPVSESLTDDHESAGIVELPLPEPKAVPAAAVATAPLPQPERRLTLFQRMMQLSRKTDAEESRVETLAPEPEPEAELRIPPFMRRQQN